MPPRLEKLKKFSSYFRGLHTHQYYPIYQRDSTAGQIADTSVYWIVYSSLEIDLFFMRLHQRALHR